MPDYTLNLEINPSDLATIREANQKIIIAKPVNGGSPNVAWLAFDPFQQNTVEWEENYGMYASLTTVQHGATISRLSTSPYPAAPATSYTFNEYANFAGPTADSSVGPTTFQVVNEMPASQHPSLKFGLMQEAVVNGQTQGTKPLNIASVPAQNTADFTPVVTVFVWLQAHMESSTVITDVSSDHLKVTYTYDNEITVHYENGMGMFATQS